MGINVLSDQLLLVCHICSQLSLALQVPSCSRLLPNCSKNEYQKDKIGRVPYATVFPTLQQLWFTYLQTQFRKIAQNLLFFYHSIKNSFFSLFFLMKQPLTVELNDVCYRNLELFFVYLFVSNCNKVLIFLYYLSKIWHHFHKETWKWSRSDHTALPTPKSILREVL